MYLFPHHHHPPSSSPGRSTQVVVVLQNETLKAYDYIKLYSNEGKQVTSGSIFEATEGSIERHVSYVQQH